MRVKLGPYKISTDLWMRLQVLPGETDEQRVLLALDAACGSVEAAIEKHRHTTQLAKMRMAQLVEEERTKVKAATEGDTTGDGQ